ncbi:hypothetical protein LXL04_004547 [Taraxacum kok-saghyz]
MNKDGNISFSVDQYEIKLVFISIQATKLPILLPVIKLEVRKTKRLQCRLKLLEYSKCVTPLQSDDSIVKEKKQQILEFKGF